MYYPAIGVVVIPTFVLFACFTFHLAILVRPHYDTRPSQFVDLPAREEIILVWVDMVKFEFHGTFRGLSSSTL